jgi:universal stress protein E
MHDTDTQPEKIFVVIDPTSEHQGALTKAVDLARHYGARIHAYLCVYSSLETDDPAMLKQVEMDRYKLWLDTFIEPIRAKGVNIDVQLDWTPSWREAMRDAALHSDCDLIIKQTTRTRGRSIMMTSSDTLLFEATKARILLTSPREEPTSNKILAAVDVARDEVRYRKLFESVMQTGRDIEKAHADISAELHVLYAYTTQEDYRHVTDVAKATGVDASRIHVVGGRPEEAIEKVAGELNTYLVIIGLSAGRRLFGATSDWILNNIHHDVLVIQR